MLTSLQKQLEQAVKDGMLLGTLKLNEPMARYTTWRIGGKAECVYQPASVADLQVAFRMLEENVTIYWIGLGSNLLVRDGGIEGLVINTNGVLNDYSYDCEEQGGKNLCRVTAQAGMPCAIFSRKAANEGINGAEFLSGIPGTIGGALAMNAGAFGGETWRNVVSVEMINHNGEIVTRMPDEFNVSYRHVELKEKTQTQWFVSGTFCYEKDPQGLAKSKQEIKRLLEKRAQTQPTKQANAGSVFKNPEHDYAARLIESCGLKGEAINDAQVSEKHANFIVNRGNAQASDVEALIKKIQATVLEQHHIKLEPEVHIIGQH